MSARLRQPVGGETPLLIPRYNAFSTEGIHHSALATWTTKTVLELMRSWMGCRPPVQNKLCVALCTPAHTGAEILQSSVMRLALMAHTWAESGQADVLQLVPSRGAQLEADLHDARRPCHYSSVHTLLGS